MHKLTITALAVLLVACSPTAPASPPSTPVPLPSPTPTATPTPGATPTATPASSPTPLELLLPGTSTLAMRWTWDVQGPPTQALDVALTPLRTPDDVGAFLASHVTWRDDYDTSHFLSPNELLAQGFGVCNAYARFWCAALERQGFRPDVVSFWGPDSAHSIALWRDAGGHYRLASNQQWSELTDLGFDRDAAIVRSAVEFYGSTWSTILVHDPDSGQIRQRIDNPDVSPAPVTDEVSARNVFTLRK